VSFLPTKRLPRVAQLLLAGAVAIGVSGCGISTRPAAPRNVTAVELANGFEPYFWSGPVTYQVQVSRQLNPFSFSDVQYLAGVKDAQQLGPNEFWYGVFLWAKNQTNRFVHSADHFRLFDSAGQAFYPVKLNPSVNPFAWTSQVLGPNGTEPADGSIPASMSTMGDLILFKLPESVYSNRPLMLQVYTPGERHPSDVSLDL
jgi:hypothetical protein